VCCYQSLPGLVAELVALGRRVCLFVGDEAHRTECDTIHDAWTQLDPVSAIGVTATPYRADAAETLSLWTEVVYRYTLAEAWRDGVLVPYVHLRMPTSWAREIGDEGEDALDRACLRLIREAETRGLAWAPMMASAYDIADAEHFAAVLCADGIPADYVHSQRSPADNERAIRSLKAGEVRVLVQVNMLSEGTDYPWLRGLLQRRDMGSPVMAFQFLGRGLRSHPGKDYCVILDPHRNLDRHGVSRPEQLGEAMEQAAAASQEVDEDAEAGADRGREIRVKFVSAVEEWAADVLMAMEAAGLYQRRRYALAATGDEWRDAGPSSAQRRTLERMRWATRHLPKHARKPCRALLDSGDQLPRGAVSDLISILIALADATQATRTEATKHAAETGSWRGGPKWQWPPEVEIPSCPPPPKRQRSKP